MGLIFLMGIHSSILLEGGLEHPIALCDTYVYDLTQTQCRHTDFEMKGTLEIL